MQPNPTQDRLEREWQQKIKLLVATVWDRKINDPCVERWLKNFNGQVDSVENERFHAYHLLQQFMYFGHPEIKELLRALYRDLFLYPTVQHIKKVSPHATFAEMQHSFQEELKATRFLGVGTPAESGTHLLYYFRQENHLPKDVFTTLERIYRFSKNEPPEMRDRSIRTFVYLDDFCGSGQQVKSYLAGAVEGIRSKLPDSRILYLMLFATTKGMLNVKNAKVFDDVSAVIELDDHYRTFSKKSIYFKNSADIDIDRSLSRRIMIKYGKALDSGNPLGYGCCQLLLGLFHNTPDNTLPTFWAEQQNPLWHPIFPRYSKLYDWNP